MGIGHVGPGTGGTGSGDWGAEGSWVSVVCEDAMTNRAAPVVPDAATPPVPEGLWGVAVDADDIGCRTAIRPGTTSPGVGATGAVESKGSVPVLPVAVITGARSKEAGVVEVTTGSTTVVTGGGTALMTGATGAMTGPTGVTTEFAVESKGTAGAATAAIELVSGAIVCTTGPAALETVPTTGCAARVTGVATAVAPEDTGFPAGDATGPARGGADPVTAPAATAPTTGCAVCSKLDVADVRGEAVGESVPAEATPWNKTSKTKAAATEITRRTVQTRAFRIVRLNAPGRGGQTAIPILWRMSANEPRVLHPARRVARGTWRRCATTTPPPTR